MFNYRPVGDKDRFDKNDKIQQQNRNQKTIDDADARAVYDKAEAEARAVYEKNKDK